MRTNIDPEPDDTLLDATLRDEDWQAANAAVKARALRTFRTRQRVRRLARWTGSVAALALAILGAAHWFSRSTTPPRPIMVAHITAPKAPDAPRRLTDAELVAAFPKGSCFIAEVDGKKDLIFLDREVEHAHVARSGRGGY